MWFYFLFCWLLLMLLIFQYLQPTFKNHNFPIRMREETIYVYVKYRVEGKNPKLFDNWGQNKKGEKSPKNLIWFFRFCFLGVTTFLKLLLVHDLWSKFCIIYMFVWLWYFGDHIITFAVWHRDINKYLLRTRHLVLNFI